MRHLTHGYVNAFQEVVNILLKHHSLTWEMAKRELSDRYAGQAFGIVWAIAHPLFMIGLYVFIFAFVFKAKIGGTVQLPLDYTTYILSGLIPWMAFQESINKSCTAITANAGLVKQVVFPLEILPAKSVLVSLLPLFISLLILLGYVLVKHGGFFMTYFLLLPLIVFQILAMLGMAYMLAAIGAYFRDIKDIAQLFSMSGMYLMPIFYLPEMVPSLFKPILYFNPFSYMAWVYQDVLYFGRIEHVYAWVMYPILSIASFIIGYRLFRKVKPGFGNML